MKRLSDQLFKTKDLTNLISETHDPSKRLKKVLGPVDLILLGVGAVIGAGIFTTIGTAAAGDAFRPGAGPSLILSFIITAIACGFAALCYAEFASMVPVSGSAYTYSYATFGELIAWIVGWDLMLEYCVGAIAVSISWSGYFLELLNGFGIILPPWATLDFRSAMQGFEKASLLLSNGASLAQLDPSLQRTWAAVQQAPHFFGLPLIINAPACFIIVAITSLLVVGIKESSRFNAIIVAIKILVLGFFVFMGSCYLKPENWTPFTPNGFAGIKAGAAIVFFAYIGFDCVSTAAEETQNPKRDLPIGIIGSLIVCTIVYVIVAAVFTGLVPFNELKNAMVQEKAKPLTFALQHIGQNWAISIIAFGSIAAQIAVLLVLLLGQSRIFFSMSRDGLLPPIFSKVHHRFKTPYVTTIFGGLLITVFASFSNIDEIVDLTNIGTLFAFALVCFGVIILRVKEPHRARGFKVPFSPVIPLLGVGSCIFLMTGLAGITWLRFFVWMGIGLAVYFLYGIRHSALHRSQPHHHK